MKAKPSSPAPQPAPAPVPPPPVPLPVASAPNRWRRWALPVLLLAAAAGGVLWYSFGRDVPPEPPEPSGITDDSARKALDAARAKLLETPRDGAAWGEYGTVLLANLFDKEAVACFLEAEKRDPRDPRWPYARGLVALKRAPETALPLLELAAEKAKASRTYRQSLTLTFAEALLELGEADRAAALFQAHLTPPDPERAEYGLGLIALTRGDDAAATRRFEAAVGHPACRKQCTSQLALLARRRGDLTAAKQYEAEAAVLDQDPPWPDPYLDRVVTLQVGHRGSARRISVLQRDRKFREAANLYLEMVQEDRTSKALTGAAVNLARLASESGKRDRYDEMIAGYDEAIGHLREAVRIDPADTNAQYTLALVLFNKWEKVAVHAPDTPGLADGFREVAAHARKTVELKPDHGRGLLFWGLALKYLGENRAAIDPLRRGLTIAPEMFDLHLALGQVLAATGDRSGARTSFATAKQLKPQDPRPDDELFKLGR